MTLDDFHDINVVFKAATLSLSLSLYEVSLFSHKTPRVTVITSLIRSWQIINNVRGIYIIFKQIFSRYDTLCPSLLYSRNTEHFWTEEL